MSLNEAVKFIQVTDSHLFETASQRLIGVNTEDSLRAVIKLVAEENSVSGILATGDLSQDGSLKSYQRFADILRDLAVPIYWTPGNHDNSASFHAAPENFPLSRRSVIEAGNWRILLLDSVLPGYNSGYLATTELDYLKENIRDDGKHHLLVLHHQPVPCGSAWLDTMKLDNSDDFLRLITSRSSVKAVLYGHIHQAGQQDIANISFFSTPSTCFQFAPDTNEFSLDWRMPGYRRLMLYDDGSIETDVIRVTDFDLNLETAANGY
jgi:Icc protein